MLTHGAAVLPNAVVHPVFQGKNGIQRWLAAILATNRLRASEPYPLAAAVVEAIRRLLRILTIGAVVLPSVNPIRPQEKGAKGCEWRVLVLLL